MRRSAVFTFLAAWLGLVTGMEDFAAGELTLLSDMSEVKGPSPGQHVRNTEMEMPKAEKMDMMGAIAHIPMGSPLIAACGT